MNAQRLTTDLDDIEPLVDPDEFKRLTTPPLRKGAHVRSGDARGTVVQVWPDGAYLQIKWTAGEFVAGCTLCTRTVDVEVVR